MEYIVYSNLSFIIMGKSNDVINGGHHAKFQTKLKHYMRTAHHSRRNHRRSLIAMSAEDAEDIILIHNLGVDSDEYVLNYQTGKKIPNIPNLPLYCPEEFIKKHKKYACSRKELILCSQNIDITPHSVYAHMPLLEVMKHKQTDPYYARYTKNAPPHRLATSRYITASIKQIERRGEMKAFKGWRRQPRGIFDSDESLDLWRRDNTWRGFTIGRYYDDGWYGW